MRPPLLSLARITGEGRAAGGAGGGVREVMLRRPSWSVRCARRDRYGFFGTGVVGSSNLYFGSSTVTPASFVTRAKYSGIAR